MRPMDYAQRLVLVLTLRNANKVGGTAASIVLAVDKTDDSTKLSNLGKRLVALSSRLETERLADFAVRLETMDRDAFESFDKVLSTFREGQPRNRVRRRFLEVASATGCLAHQPHAFVVPAILQSVLKPHPPPLPAQMLVGLLKHPLCVREARRLVLDQLTRHYNRPFADHWDFVEYAKQQKLDLDLTSPLSRPE